MRRHVLAAAAAAAALLAASPVAAQNRTAGSSDLTPEDGASYVTLAGAFHLFEARAAEMARERAAEPAVRQFAGSAAGDYEARLERLRGAARGLGLDEFFPPAMLPMHWDMLRDLEDASSSRFDDHYVDQQVRVHEIAVELHRNYAQNGDSPALREIAETAAARASRHLAEVRALD